MVGVSSHDTAPAESAVTAVGVRNGVRLTAPWNRFSCCSSANASADDGVGDGDGDATSTLALGGGVPSSAAVFVDRGTLPEVDDDDELPV